MSPENTIQNFIFEHLPIRGEIVRLDESYREVLEKHAYPEPVKRILTEALLASILLMGSVKFEGHLTLQFQSKGFIKLLVARCNSEFHIRAVAQYDLDKTEEIDGTSNLLGEGELVVTIAQNNSSQPYQSIIPLVSGDIIKSLEYYFAQSEQLPTKIFLKATDTNALAILLQVVPNEQNFSEQLLDYAFLLQNVMDHHDLVLFGNDQFIHLAFPEHDIRFFDKKTIIPRCHCTIERMKDAILLLGEKEAREILISNLYLDVTCEFCNNSFSFNESEVNQIFSTTKH
jgi:molecular chaperone Hsp33